MITKSMLLLMAALAALAAAGPAVADLVTIEAGDYSIALNVDLVKNDSQEIDAGSLTYPWSFEGHSGRAKLRRLRTTPARLSR